MRTSAYVNTLRQSQCFRVKKTNETKAVFDSGKLRRVFRLVFLTSLDSAKKRLEELLGVKRLLYGFNRISVLIKLSRNICLTKKQFIFHVRMQRQFRKYSFWPYDDIFVDSGGGTPRYDLKCCVKLIR